MEGTLIIIAIVILALMVFFSVVPVGLWISSMASGVKVGLFSLVGMKLRRVRPQRILLPMIKATKAGLTLNMNELEAHYLAGGNVDGVVDALIASERAGIDLSFEKAAAIDLAGREVLEAVKMSVNPKVIETPNISAVAKDGIELLVKARVTVRANLERLVGGHARRGVAGDDGDDSLGHAALGDGLLDLVGDDEILVVLAGEEGQRRRLDHARTPLVQSAEELDGVAALDELERALAQPKPVERLGHADLLEARVVAAEHHLMAQAAVDPRERDLVLEETVEELARVVEVEDSRVGVDVGILDHEHRALLGPRPSEARKADA